MDMWKVYMHGGDEKYVNRFYLQNVKGKNQLGDLMGKWD
jgi:hypothetical protein